MRRSTQDERPWSRLARNEPHRILASFELLPLDQHVVIERHSRRRISTGVPNAVPGYELAEEHSTVRHGPSVAHRNLCKRDILCHAPALTERISLRSRSAERSENGRDEAHEVESHE